MASGASPVGGSSPYAGHTAAMHDESDRAAQQRYEQAQRDRQTGASLPTGPLPFQFEHQDGSASVAAAAAGGGGGRTDSAHADRRTPKPLSSWPIEPLSDDEVGNLFMMSFTGFLWQLVTEWRNESPEAHTAERVGKKFVAALVYLITPLLAMIEAVFRAVLLILVSPGLFLLLKKKEDQSDSDKIFLGLALSAGLLGAFCNITTGTGLVAANYLNFTEEHMPNVNQICESVYPCLKD
jgi:hypothetical protein